MVRGEIVQLREIIEALQSAICGNDQAMLYDFMAQVEVLYSSAIPEVTEVYGVAKDNSRLLIRQSKVIQQLLKRYLIRIETEEDSRSFKIDNGCEEGVTYMNIQEYKQKVYRVIVSVLQMPDANPKVLAEKCGMSVPDFYEVLSFAKNEGLIRGIKLVEGGNGRTPLVAFYSNAQQTMAGLNFMSQFESRGIPQLQGVERPTVFISYNQKSGSDFVDALEQALTPCATVLRDKTTMETWDSFSAFMKTIRKQDFAVMVITPDYLRSVACMFEVCELMKDDNWKEKVMFAVLDTSIYVDGSSEYVQYWQDKENVLREQAKAIDIKNAGPIVNEINKIGDIQRRFGEFYEAVCDSNNPKLWDIKDRIIERIRTTANTSFVESLDNTQFATEKEEQINRLL